MKISVSDLLTAVVLFACLGALLWFMYTMPSPSKSYQDGFRDGYSVPRDDDRWEIALRRFELRKAKP